MAAGPPPGLALSRARPRPTPDAWSEGRVCSRQLSGQQAHFVSFSGDVLEPPALPFCRGREREAHGPPPRPQVSPGRATRQLPQWPELSGPTASGVHPALPAHYSPKGKRSRPQSPAGDGPCPRPWGVGTRDGAPSQAPLPRGRTVTSPARRETGSQRDLWKREGRRADTGHGVDEP